MDKALLKATNDYCKDGYPTDAEAMMIIEFDGSEFEVESHIKTAEKIAKENNIWVIEDSCDGLGGTYKDQQLGSFGDLATLSFYPAHHITTGEGGLILTNDKKIIKYCREYF